MYGLKINNYIYKILSTDTSVLSLVNKANIKPLIQNPTGYPFISYQRDSIETEYCKDGTIEDIVGVQLICVSDKYDESVNVAQKVRECFENKIYSDDNAVITEMRIDDASENVIDNAFVQTLFMTFKIQKNN